MSEIFVDFEDLFPTLHNLEVPDGESCKYWTMVERKHHKFEEYVKFSEQYPMTDFRRSRLHILLMATRQSVFKKITKEPSKIKDVIIPNLDSSEENEETIITKARATRRLNDMKSSFVSVRRANFDSDELYRDLNQLFTLQPIKSFSVQRSIQLSASCSSPTLSPLSTKPSTSKSSIKPSKYKDPIDYEAASCSSPTLSAKPSTSKSSIKPSKYKDPIDYEALLKIKKARLDQTIKVNEEETQHVDQNPIENPFKLAESNFSPVKMDEFNWDLLKRSNEDSECDPFKEIQNIPLSDTQKRIDELFHLISSKKNSENFEQLMQNLEIVVQMFSDDNSVILTQNPDTL